MSTPWFVAAGALIARCVAWASMLIATSAANAQCGGWLAVDGVHGAATNVATMTLWDPDGTGPQQPLVVVGGQFTSAGGTAANNIATYDPATGAWAQLGAGVNGIVRALAVLPNGDLIAGGSFTSAGGVPANRAARWNGSVWAPLGVGLGSDSQFGAYVAALAVLPNGDVIAGGSFTTAGGAPATRIARWDGAAWYQLGAGMNNVVRALVVLPTGEIVAGGGFSHSAGIPTGGLVRWTGSLWVPLGPDYVNGVLALSVLSNGDVVASGSFANIGEVYGFNGVARWDGSGWSSLGFGVPSAVYAIAESQRGDLTAGGTFPGLGGLEAVHIARWNGTAWSPLDGGVNESVRAIVVLPDGDLFVGGAFTRAGSQEAAYVARYAVPGRPSVVRQPESQSLPEGGTFTLSASPATGTSGVRVQWYHDGQLITDGPGGASQGGGVVSGASHTLVSPTDGSYASLQILNSRVSDSGRYAAVFTNDCGTALSAEAAVVVVRQLRVDYNLDGTLNPDDLGDYITDYYTSPPIPGPGGYAVSCPGNAAPYDRGYKTGYTIDGLGTCAEPNLDTFGDYITSYFQDCC